MPGCIADALTALNESVQFVVVRGHRGKGAVTAAVNAYLNPLKDSSARTGDMLRSIVHRFFVPVHPAAMGIDKV